MSLFISAKQQEGYRGDIWVDDTNSGSECPTAGRLQKTASATSYTRASITRMLECRNL